tara:strand:+ start:1599 stop:3029 length:1431 start_codon:yes stop_codon:yes gene_type:complete
MPLRNVPITYTLDQQRQEINNLAVDFNDLDINFSEKVDDRVNALVTGGTGISTSYDDVNNTLSFSVDFTEFTSSNITEGVTSNLFFTTPRANTAIDDRVTKTFVNNLGVDSLGTLQSINLQQGNLTRTVSAINYNNQNWDAAFSWGNHANAGYVTSFSETDTLDSVTDRGAVTTNTINVGKLKTNDIESITATDSIVMDAVDVFLDDTNFRVGSYSTGLANDYGVFLEQTGAIVVNHDGVGDVFTLKVGGTTNFKIGGDGKLNDAFILPPVDGGAGQFLVTNGSGQLGWSTQNSASVEVGDDPPAGPSEGDLWWESDAGRLKVYYSNGSNPATWIDASPPLSAPTPGSAIRDAAGNISANNNAVFADTNGDFKAQLTTSSYERIMVSLTFGYLSGTASTSGSVILQRVVSGTATDIFTVYCPEPSNSNGPFEFQYVDTHGQVPNTLIQYQLKLDLGGAGNRSTGTTYSSQLNLHEI